MNIFSPAYGLFLTLVLLLHSLFGLQARMGMGVNGARFNRSIVGFGLSCFGKQHARTTTSAI